MKTQKILFIILPFVFFACSSTETATTSSESKLSLFSITGELLSGEIREGIKITGKHFNRHVVVSLLTMAGTEIADLLVTSVSAKEIEAKLPTDTVPGDYIIQLTKGRAQVAQTVSILRGEKGEKGDTGDIGPQGLKGDIGDTGPQGDPGADGTQGPQGEQGEKGDTGDAGLGALHAIANDGEDIGYVIDVGSSHVKVWASADSSPHLVNLTTGEEEDDSEIVKIYFTTEDCSGTPYTYSPLTSPNARYRSFATLESLETTNNAVNLYIPKVNDSRGACVVEGASYDLWEAAWVGPMNTYEVPITIEPR